MNSADDYLGKILEAVKKREEVNFDEDWLVIVSTDHGRDKKGKNHSTTLYQYQSEKLVFLATNKQFNREYYPII